MPTEDDIVETVDELVDNLDPMAVDREADRLFDGDTDALIARIVTELKARLEN